jgi:hypothetical protein
MDGSRNAKPHLKTKQHIPSPKLRRARDKKAYRRFRCAFSDDIWFTFRVTVQPRTSFAAVHESRCGTSRASRDVRLESAKWEKADIDQVAINQPRFYESTPYKPRLSWRGSLFVGPRASWGNCPTPHQRGQGSPARGAEGPRGRGMDDPPTGWTDRGGRLLIRVCKKSV